MNEIEYDGNLNLVQIREDEKRWTVQRVTSSETRKLRPKDRLK